MMKTHFLNAQKLPLVVECDQREATIEKLFELTIEQKNFFREKLLQYGALLFRGFQIKGIEEFESFVDTFSGEKKFNYAGGVSPRLALTGGGVYTSTEYPADLPLALHNELSYSEIYPRHLYFFCLTEPKLGGETTLGDSRRILRRVSPKIVGLFKHKKVRYDRNLQAEKGTGYSWQEAFETEKAQAVEEICNRIGAEFEWKPNGALRLSQIRPATATHPETGEQIWFNQADGFHPSNLDAVTRQAVLANQESFRLESYFGDGSPICVEMLEHVREVLRAETVPHRWQKGDVLILDNMLTAHGRMPYSGARKIALAMT